MSMPEEQHAKVNSQRTGVKFTVVVTTHNYAHLLPDALRALVAQTSPDFELLIVDDGSTDNTQEVVEQFRPRFQDYRYLKQPQSGPAAARNFGAQQARGTHVAILDADDIWSPRYLETVRGKFESNPQVEVVFSDGLRILGNGRVLRPVFPPHLPVLDGPINSVEELFSLCTYFLPSGMVFLKSLYDRIGAFDTRFLHGDDFEWVVRAAIGGAYCLRIDQKLFLYRLHGGNLTNNAIAFLETWLRVYEERMKSSRLGPECERRARHFARDYVLRLLGICSPSQGRALLARSLESLQGDVFLRWAYLSTYLGSSYAIRPLKWGQNLFRMRRAGAQQVDLTAPPEIIFQSL
jgi:glycosyltransferase involved in cell wall biosynthesis